MKNTVPVSAMLLLISCNALAGSEYDRCIKEEKTLKAQEAGECSGLRYLLNPSACFATQKALKEYRAGKCRQIGMAEHVDFSSQVLVPEKKSAVPAGVGKAESNGTTGNVTGVSKFEIAAGKKTEPEELRQETTHDQLKEENSRLKAEIIRLKAENELLRKTRQ